MLFQQIGLINCNDLDTFRPLSLIAGPRWLSICSFIFADLVARSFHSGRIAVTIGKYPLHSIARLQGKLPLSFRILRILRILQDFKSQEWSNTSQFSLPPSNNPQKKIWTQDDTSASTIVHRPLETSQAPRPHRLEWRFPEPAKQRKRPANVIPNGYTSCSTSVPCENTAGQKQRQKDGAIRLFSSKPMENPIV